MIQKTIRDWGSVEFTTTEGAEQQTEWNDRTVYATDGYNSIAELGAGAQAIEAITDFITIANAIDLDAEKAARILNTAKITYPSADSTKVGFITITQAVNLDTVESDTATNNAKVTYDDAAQVATNKTNADASKVVTDWISITQAVDLDAMETKLATIETSATADQSDAEIKTAYENNASTNAYDDTEKAQVATNKTNADASKVKTDFLTVTQAVDLDTMESDITTNNAKTGVTTEEANTIDSELEAGMTGEAVVLNVLSLTQAQYDAGTKTSTTFYIITDA